MVKLDNEIIITKQYVIHSYEILYINLKINVCGQIYIMLFYNDTETIEKNFTLIGSDYDNWTNDDYLYEYISNNIVKIFNN